MCNFLFTLISSLHRCCNPSLGVATKVRACKGVGQEGSLGVTSHAPGSVGECEGSKWAPTLGVGISMILEFSKSNCNAQNPLDWRIIYIIEKLLERRCLKWSHMTHLDTSNTSYGQKKGRESNWQFDSRPLKVGNRSDFLVCRWRATYCWKFLDEGYNFASDLISIGSLQTKLWALKIAKVWILGILGLPLRSLGTKCHSSAGSVAKNKIYYKGEGGGFPQVRAVVSLVNSSLPVACPNTKVLHLCNNQLVVWFVQFRVNDWLLVILPSLIPELQHAPSTPKVLRTKERAPTPYSFIVFTSYSYLSLSRSLGARQ
jgi:hypothetical protein